MMKMRYYLAALALCSTVNAYEPVNICQHITQDMLEQLSESGSFSFNGYKYDVLGEFKLNGRKLVSSGNDLRAATHFNNFVCKLSFEGGSDENIILKNTPEGDMNQEPNSPTSEDHQAIPADLCKDLKPHELNTALRANGIVTINGTRYHVGAARTADLKDALSKGQVLSAHRNELGFHVRDTNACELFIGTPVKVYVNPLNNDQNQ